MPQILFTTQINHNTFNSFLLIKSNFKHATPPLTHPYKSTIFMNHKIPSLQLLHPKTKNLIPKGDQKMNRRKKQKKAQQQLDLKLKGKEKVKEIMIFDLKLIHTRQR